MLALLRSYKQDGSYLTQFIEIDDEYDFTLGPYALKNEERCPIVGSNQQILPIDNGTSFFMAGNNMDDLHDLIRPVSTTQNHASRIEKLLEVVNDEELILALSMAKDTPIHGLDYWLLCLERKFHIA